MVLCCYCCKNSKVASTDHTEAIKPRRPENVERSLIQETSYNAAHRRQQETHSSHRANSPIKKDED